MPNSVAIPLIGKTSRALELVSQPIWICLGRTTPWQDDSNPPSASPEVSFLDEPIIYKRCEVVTFAVEDENGEYTVNGVRYRAVSANYARTHLVSTILIKATIYDTDVDETVTFRQVGLYTKLVPAEGKENQVILEPDEVIDPGFLEWYTNREPVYIQPNQHQIFLIVLYF